MEKSTQTFEIISESEPKAFNKDELILLILILMFCFLNVFGAFFQPEFLGFNSYRRSLRAIDNPMRWLLMIPILFIFKRYIISSLLHVSSCYTIIVCKKTRGNFFYFYCI